jgi:hypothetical protein
VKGRIQTSQGEKKVDSGNPWSEFESWGGKSWFESHAKKEAEETITDEHAERTADIEPCDDKC